MKTAAILLFTILFFGNHITAQDKLPTLDKSSMDMSYYPSNFPVSKISNKSTEPLIARIIYSRPAMNGRKIFGELVEYNKVWRFGANEATEIEFFKDVYINKVKIKKGRYTLYAIPGEKNWTMIISKEVDTWGAFAYDNKKDLVRIDVSSELLADKIETFAIYFDKINSNSFGLYAYWENTKIVLPISISKTN
ncbi:MAG: DUF2911 domain-containing protein [Bacteroidota bacterium]